MPLEIESVIIKILTNSQQAISDIKAVDRNVENLGKKAVGSAKSIIGMAAAFGGVRGAIDLAVKAVGSYIKNVKAAQEAFIKSGKDQEDYYNQAAAVIIEIDKLKEQAQINDGKRRAEELKWLSEIQLKWMQTNAFLKDNAALMEYLEKQWAPFGSAARKEFKTFQQFVDNYFAQLTENSKLTKDSWQLTGEAQAAVGARSVLVKADLKKASEDQAAAELAQQAEITKAIESRNAASLEAMASESEATRKRLSDEQLWRDSQAEWADIAIEKIKEEAQANRDAAVEILNAWSNTMGAIGSLVSNRYQAQIDAAEDGSAKQKELMRKQFNAEKAMAITQSLIATAVGITKAIPNIPLMIFSAASGALQTAAIAATRPPKFATGTPPGGYIVPPGYDNDSYPVMARSGERVEVTPNGGGGGGQTVILQLDGKTLGRAITGLLRDRMALVPAGAIVA